MARRPWARVPISLRLPAIVAIALIGIALSTMALNAAGVASGHRARDGAPTTEHNDRHGQGGKEMKGRHPGGGGHGRAR
jgi:hypothetical protein